MNNNANYTNPAPVPQKPKVKPADAGKPDRKPDRSIPPAPPVHSPYINPAPVPQKPKVKPADGGKPDLDPEEIAAAAAKAESEKKKADKEAETPAAPLNEFWPL